MYGRHVRGMKASRARRGGAHGGSEALAVSASRANYLEPKCQSARQPDEMTKNYYGGARAAIWRLLV